MSGYCTACFVGVGRASHAVRLSGQRMRPPGQTACVASVTAIAGIRMRGAVALPHGHASLSLAHTGSARVDARCTGYRSTAHSVSYCASSSRTCSRFSHVHRHASELPADHQGHVVRHIMVRRCPERRATREPPPTFIRPTHALFPGPAQSHAISMRNAISIAISIAISLRATRSRRAPRSCRPRERARARRAAAAAAGRLAACR